LNHKEFTHKTNSKFLLDLMIWKDHKSWMYTREKIIK
jgi:hypothetical protein